MSLDHDRAPAPPKRAEPLVRWLAYAGVPTVLAAALAISFLVELTPAGRLLVISGGGVGATLALIAPWLLSRRA